MLLKDGGREAVERELLASQICQCFAASQVVYEKAFFDKEPVTLSWNITSKEYSIVSMESFEIYIQNHGGSVREAVLALDSYNYYMMNILDYLTGNTDRHWGNWGVLVENQRNKPVSLHKLMDFNQAFHAYDKIEGSNCQTGFGERMTQRGRWHKGSERNRTESAKTNKTGTVLLFPGILGNVPKKTGTLKRIQRNKRGNGKERVWIWLYKTGIWCTVLCTIDNTGITLFFVHFCMTLNCLKAFCADDVFHTACVFSSSLRINAQMDQPGA